MERYNIFIKPSAVKEIEVIALKKDRQNITNKIKKLSENPRVHGCEKLSGQNKYRIRQGSYRIIYSIDDATLTVLVVKIGHRKDICR